MCGIVAFVSASPRFVTPIRGMTALARHRGPDDEGYLIVPAAAAAPVSLGGDDTPREALEGGLSFLPSRHVRSMDETSAIVAFGHRRLSIVDLSIGGHQPMSTPDGRYWIIYNGEIYNFRELREELARLGRRFVTHSDTEVILAAYAEWGPESLHRLNGMFAFVIYDAQVGEIFAARDRFGIKPLYYWVAPDDTVCLASEIKQFTAFPGWKATVNRARAVDFLAQGLTDHTDETMFAGVYQLGPGCYLRLPALRRSAGADGRVPTERWYRLDPPPFIGSFEEAVSECRRLVIDAVRLELRADVPVGSCLSGGIDSSSIVCVMHGLLGEQESARLQKTFSAVSDLARLDERPWIAEVVAATGVESHVVTPAFAGLEASLDAITWHQDEPYPSTSIFAQWCVFDLAARGGVKVMLDGQGADEQFAGYHSFFAPYLTGLLRSGRLAPLIADARSLARRHGYSARYALPGIVRQLFAREGTRDLNTASRAMLTSRNLQMLLRWEDRSSMAHSVEARVPFLDHRLVELALGLPDTFKLGGGITKRVLRAAMTGVLPDRIRDRVDKLAFETPEEQWMRNEGRDALARRLTAAIELGGAIIPGDRATAAQATLAGREPFSPVPWRVIAFGEWMRAFAVKALT